MPAMGQGRDMMGGTIDDAFDHPEVRSRATAPAGLRDRISLRDYVVAVEIGAFQAERGVAQRLRFGLVVEVNGNGDKAGDDVDRILSYDSLIAAVDVELAGERLDLLETLAERVAARVLLAPQAARVFVRIEKLDRGPWELGVEIVRSGGAGSDSAPGLPPFRVAFVGNEMFDLAALPGWIAAAGPLVICTGLPDLSRPRAGAADMQRRIDLLAIEQNGWALAARVPGLSVTATRTELNWAIRAGSAVVWAPAKLVLDTPGAPRDAAPWGLAAWLAGVLAATEIVVIGGAAPGPATVPVRRMAAGDLA